MINEIIYIKIIDDTQKYCQKECLVCYHGDKIPLEVKTGRIAYSLKKVNIYYDWGFTKETLNDCLMKFYKLLQKNIPNIFNIKHDFIKITFGGGDIITGADLILSYCRI